MKRNRIVRSTLPHAIALAALAALTGSAMAQLVAPSILPGSIGRLTPWEPSPGMLDESSGQNFKDGSRVQLWMFAGNAGEQVTLSVGSNEFDTYLTLVSPSGQVVDWNDDDWSESGEYWYSSTIETVLPESGRYLAVVSGWASFDLGAYEIVLGVGGPLVKTRDFESAIPLAVPGQASGVLDASLPPVGEGFSGPGHTYAFSLDRDYLTAIRAWSTETDTVIALYDSAGVLIDLNDDDWSGMYLDDELGSWTDSALTMFLTAGDYYLVVGTYSDWEPFGPYEVSVKTYVEAP